MSTTNKAALIEGLAGFTAALAARLDSDSKTFTVADRAMLTEGSDTLADLTAFLSTLPKGRESKPKVRKSIALRTYSDVDGQEAGVFWGAFRIATLLELGVFDQIGDSEDNRMKGMTVYLTGEDFNMAHAALTESSIPFDRIDAVARPGQRATVRVYKEFDPAEISAADMEKSVATFEKNVETYGAGETDDADSEEESDADES